MARAREAARNAQCKNNLRQFGIAFAAQVDSRRDKKLVSGAYDYRRDGCIDTYGWVADVVNQQAGNVTEMMCPTNPLRGLEKLNDLIGGNTSDNKGAPDERVQAGACTAWVDSGSVLTYTPANDPSGNARPRKEYINTEFLKAGYCTNYAQSWFAAREQMLTSDLNGASAFDASKSPKEGGNKSGVRGAYYGLRLSAIESAPVPSSAIAILGDAAPGDTNEAILAEDLNEELGLVAGARLAESFNDGPAFWNDNDKVALIENIDSTGAYGTGATTSGTLYQLESQDSTIGLFTGDIIPSIDGEVSANAGDDGYLFLQDTRDWFATHGGGTSAGCNILMADGSVKLGSDLNGDGFLNPGFPVTGDVEENARNVGFIDDTVELENFEIFSGPSIAPAGFVKAQFEES
ncbi:DUF1559 domain-containing protein [Blastopirellula sp. J2-11]|nr:DUF1559 domain-containing protein [Blastopirellula sp. J2-11]